MRADAKQVRRRPSRRVIGLSAAVAAIMMVVGVMLVSDDAGAWPPYLDEWKLKYPDSTLPQRMEDRFGLECMVCHNPVSFSTSGNCYREDIRDLLFDGHTILEALDIADGLDSDGDGVTNGEEILMPHADLPGEVGYNAGLSGCFGFDECGVDPTTPWTGVSETPGVSAVPGDLTCDGIVNGADLLVLLGSWGVCPSEPVACIADLDDNGTINGGDLLILLSNWG